MQTITKEDIGKFLNGRDEMEHIIKIECGYNDEDVYVIYRDAKNVKRVQIDPFYPIVWTKIEVACKLYQGDKKVIKDKMLSYGIGVKRLKTSPEGGTDVDRMVNGYCLLFYAKKKMSYNQFMKFFKEGGFPIYSDIEDDDQQNYIAVAPIEQYMIYTGKRLFKGYDDYDDLLRMQWDLETTGLDPHTCKINQIGVRTNKGFEIILTVDDKMSEYQAILNFFQIIQDIKPDVISGHNTENFDWNFISVRLEQYGEKLKDCSKAFFPKGVYKKAKQSVLKLGGEMEYYYPTCMWGYNLTDSLFAVRRAQALNSNIKKADLKYITKYSNLNKPNRVYVPGKIIGTTWANTNKTFAFDDSNGQWFEIKNSNKDEYIESEDAYTEKATNRKFQRVTGKYIVERYLLDDLYETDKVEKQYNQANYLVCKMLPVSFEKVCTMGTAAIWKYIMVAWSYEHELAIPQTVKKTSFTGGLSRLLSVGYVSDIVKLDYNSLYPSIILTYGLKTDVDLMKAMPSLLEYILTQREHYKELKAKYGKEIEVLKEKENKTPEDELRIQDLKVNKNKCELLQLPLKILGNSYFGAAGSGKPFMWSDMITAEETTCIGRQMLRMMIYHFSNISRLNPQYNTPEYNYAPIVGDSFTGDTPIFIKYNNSHLIDIQPISALINPNKIEKDDIGREYDYSKKNFQVFCRTGWVEPSYIYRHKTDKNIFRVIDNDSIVDVTEDHSLFNDKQQKIKPTEITTDTQLEYKDITYIQEIFIHLYPQEIDNLIIQFNNKELNSIPLEILNTTDENKRYFLSKIDLNSVDTNNKVLMAGILYLQRHVK